MSVVANPEIEVQSNKEINKCCKCTCKIKKDTKEYVKRAKKNYRLRKLETDPEYAEQMKQKSKQYRENNKDQYNESMRLYMQKYRAKKKAEKQATTTSIQTGLENLTIKDEPLKT